MRSEEGLSDIYLRGHVDDRSSSPLRHHLGHHHLGHVDHLLHIGIEHPQQQGEKTDWYQYLQIKVLRNYFQKWPADGDGGVVDQSVHGGERL